NYPSEAGGRSWKRGPGKSASEWNPTRPSLPEIFERGGNKAIEDAYIRHGYTMKDIAVYLEIHYATVTAARGSMKVEMFDCKT
ncbi:MAG TPA: hypothetical protein VIB79_04240, partial [Candidatus Binatia bacterium]